MDEIKHSSLTQTSNLPIVSRSALRPGQAALYDLLFEKNKTGKPIMLSEAEAIWRAKVCRNVVDGVPHAYRYIYDAPTESYRGKYMPMDSWEVRFNVVNWLTRNIGMFVIKGYLKAIPMIELAELPGAVGEE